MQTNIEITEEQVVQWLATRADAMRREGGAVSAQIRIGVCVGASDRLVTDVHVFAHLDDVCGLDSTVGAAAVRALEKFGTKETCQFKLREAAARLNAEADALAAKGVAA